MRQLKNSEMLIVSAIGHKPGKRERMKMGILRPSRVENTKDSIGLCRCLILRLLSTVDWARLMPSSDEMLPQLHFRIRLGKEPYDILIPPQVPGR